MPRRKPAPESFEEKAASSWLAEATTVAHRLANEYGAPPDSKKVGDAEAMRLWGQRDPNVDRDALAQRLMTEGLPPEEVQTLVLVQERPEFAELFAQPTQDAEFADELAGLAEFPFRFGLTADHTDDPKEQVERAEQLDRQWRKQQQGDSETGYDTGAGVETRMPEMALPAGAPPPMAAPVAPGAPMSAPMMPPVMGAMP